MEINRHDISGLRIHSVVLTDSFVEIRYWFYTHVWPYICCQYLKTSSLRIFVLSVELLPQPRLPRKNWIWPSIPYPDVSALSMLFTVGKREKTTTKIQNLRIDAIQFSASSWRRLKITMFGNFRKHDISSSKNSWKSHSLWKVRQIVKFEAILFESDIRFGSDSVSKCLDAALLLKYCTNVRLKNLSFLIKFHTACQINKCEPPPNSWNSEVFVRNLGSQIVWSLCYGGSIYMISVSTTATTPSLISHKALSVLLFASGAQMQSKSQVSGFVFWKRSNFSPLI